MVCNFKAHTHTHKYTYRESKQRALVKSNSTGQDKHKHTYKEGALLVCACCCTYLRHCSHTLLRFSSRAQLFDSNTSANREQKTGHTQITVFLDEYAHGEQSSPVSSSAWFGLVRLGSARFCSARIRSYRTREFALLLILVLLLIAQTVFVYKRFSARPTARRSFLSRSLISVIFSTASTLANNHYLNLGSV